MCATLSRQRRLCYQRHQTSYSYMRTSSCRIITSELRESRIYFSEFVALLVVCRMTFNAARVDGLRKYAYNTCSCCSTCHRYVHETKPFTIFTPFHPNAGDMSRRSSNMQKHAFESYMVPEEFSRVVAVHNS